MTIRLRKDERELIVAALEEDYDSPEGAATAIFQLVAGLLAKRDSYCVRVAWASGVLLGPVHDKRQAAKVAALAAEAFSATERAENSPTGVLPLMSPARLLEARTGLPEGTSAGCPCGHPWEGHIDQRWKPWKRGIKDYSKQPWRQPGCMNCPCKNTSERSVA